MRARGAQRLHGATLATLVASALVAGCGGPAYEVRGARATAPGTLLSAEIKRVESWRSGDLNAPVVVELELRNGDPTRAHTTAPPHLVARSVMGGPYFELALTRIGADSPEVAVPAGATRTLRLEFEPRAEAPPGPYRLGISTIRQAGNPLGDGAVLRQR